jgi:rhodanese-related sulfurtransferase
MKVFFVSLFLFVVSYEFLSASITVTTPLSEPIYVNITVAQSKDTILAHLNDPRFVILDVRTSAEYNTNHLEQGVNIDYYSTDFSDILSTFDKTKVFLIHCASGNRSGKVFTMMQNLNFQTVYNMTGGMSAWLSAGYTTTTSTSPVLASLCDTLINFKNTMTHNTDSVKVTITNAANDVITFSDITDLTGTPFATNFDRNITLSGACDYSFYLYYTPLNSLKDSITFKVQSNGGTIDFILKGTAITSINNHQAFQLPFSVYNDLNNRKIIIKSEFSDSRTTCILFDISGKMIIPSNLISENIIDYSDFKNGIYFLKIVSSGVTKIYKLPLFTK